MNNLHVLKNEIKLKSKSKILWGIIIIMCAAMILGINSIEHSNLMSLHNIQKSTYTIALGSCKYGASFACLAFSIYAVLFISKDKRKNSRMIIESNLDYSSFMLARILTVIFYEIIAVLISFIVILSIQGLVYKVPIDISVYAFTFGVILLPAVIFATLISCGLYIITENIDVPILIIIVLFTLSLVSSNYLLKWVHTNANVFSEIAGIEPLGKLIVYNRVLWLFISLTVVFAAFLLRRRYGENMVRSFKFNTKKGVLSVLTIISFSAAILTAYNEPYCMKTTGLEEYEINSSIKLQEMSPEVSLNTSKGSMEATVFYKFNNKDNNDSISFKRNTGLNINSIKVNGNEVKYTENKYGDLITIPVNKENDIDIEINYEGKIKYSYGAGVWGYISNKSVYLLENSTWIFNPLTGKENFIDIKGSITAPEQLMVVTPGILDAASENKGYKTWSFSLKSSRSDMALYAGEYVKKELVAADTNVEFYYAPEHEEYIQSKEVEDRIKEMIEYYSQTFGNYYSKTLPLKIVESSIYKPGGHSTENIISISENMVNRKLSDTPTRDPRSSFNHDMEILAHEIAHQWWGSAVEAEYDGLWSNEGLAVYSSYKYIEKMLSEEYSSFFYQMKRNSLKREGWYEKADFDKGKLSKEIAFRLESLMIKNKLYNKMFVMLIEGEKKIGEQDFLKNLSKIYSKYMNKSINYDDFLNEMNISEEVLSLEQH